MTLLPMLLAPLAFQSVPAPAAFTDQPAAHAYAGRYLGQSVVRVEISTPGQLRNAELIAETIWSERTGLGPIELQVRRDRLDELRAIGLEPEILIDDLQAVVDEERREIDAEPHRPGADRRLRGEPGAAHELRYWDLFRDPEDLEQRLFDLVGAYPELATISQIGQSVEGRPIWAVEITGPDTPTSARQSRPVVMWNGTQHAREWISPATMIFIISSLLDRYDSDPRVRGLVDSINFAIVPVVNPDGYAYAWTSERYWRKNLRDNGDGYYGVDLNRNWSVEWGGLGSSGSTWSSTYRGPAPFSEPETAAVAQFALSFGDRFAGGIDYHSYSQLIMWPWGYDYGAALPEPELSIISAISIDMAGAIWGRTREGYIPQKSSDLYAAAGSLEDWYQGGTPGLGLIIELRDHSDFNPSRDNVLPCAVENFDAALLYAEGVTQPLRLEPIGLPTSAEPGQTVTITARITDSLETLDPGTARLVVRQPGESEQTVPMADLGAGLFSGEFVVAGDRGRVELWIAASSTIGGAAVFPRTDPEVITVLPPDSCTLFADDFETDRGWTFGDPDDDATGGLWAHGDPATDPNHPTTDISAQGSNCLVTGLDPGDDLRRGRTTAASPTIVIPGQPGDLLLDAMVWRIGPTTDPVLVELAADGSNDWTLVDAIWPPQGEWTPFRTRVNDFVGSASSLRVRFVAMDRPSSDLVEAAVDDVVVTFAPRFSLADLNHDGLVDFGDLDAFIGLFLARAPAADLNADGLLDFGDIDRFLAAFMAG